MSLPIKLISTDFDGTLHAEFENPPVPHDLQSLIADLQAQGAKWIINTGRDLSSVMEGIARARLHVKPDYLVVVERDIYLHRNSSYVECHPWNQGCREAHARLYSRVRPEVPKLNARIQQKFSATLYEDEFSPFCMIAENNAAADGIMAYLDEFCRQFPKLTVVRNDIYARFAHINYNKGTAMAEIARQLGVAVDEIFAAGDHLNDIPMLSGEFGRCVAAPDNAIPLVKELVRKQGGYVSHQPWGHGVARALEYYLNQRK